VNKALRDSIPAVVDRAKNVVWALGFPCLAAFSDQFIAGTPQPIKFQRAPQERGLGDPGGARS
jgi:hypothetical protein